jgi:hypothetical protein
MQSDSMLVEPSPVFDRVHLSMWRGRPTRYEKAMCIFWWGSMTTAAGTPDFGARSHPDRHLFQPDGEAGAHVNQ